MVITKPMSIGLSVKEKAPRSHAYNSIFKGAFRDKAVFKREGAVVSS